MHAVLPLHVSLWTEQACSMRVSCATSNVKQRVAATRQNSEQDGSEYTALQSISLNETVLWQSTGCADVMVLYEDRARADQEI